MKRATLEATDENILQSIKKECGTRNAEIKDFIEALELIEGNMFISLDARWGEGKTFYVRQIEKTLEYQTMKNFSTDDTQDELDKMKLYFTGTTLEEINLKHSYLPVYYNAWLYDNHGDPLMSLLYVIVKKCGIWIDSKLTKDKTEKLKDLIKSVQVSLGMFSIGGDKVIDSFIEKDIFKDIQLAEDIRQEADEAVKSVDGTFDGLKKSFESENQGANYDTTMGYYKTAKEMYKNGLVGTDDFKSMAQFGVGYDIAKKLKDNADAYTYAWHQLNNENDLYYKNLYPVTEKQYNRLTELQEESVFPLSEDLIMQVINAVEYKQDGWNPAHYKRGMCGIGYNGMAVGKGIYEKSYIKWKDMMQRCHDKEVHKKYKPEYADKCVCEEWQNYANFKLWYDEHHVFGNRIDLDKDILKPGNKEYSPETCVLIEHYINTIFERHAQDNIYENEDGKYFVGSNRKKVYETYDEVFEFACNKKKERIEKVAEKNLGRIPKCAYDAMLRYDVEALIRRDVIAA